ncbi:tautomerase family protein [Rhizobium sp. 16-449-1b]|uniref:tautomerase family protein n=1 Tax=Rhizobium sp. 16-449-1b TaxID=2819989 RepID=UPI001AD97AE2|nr:tautomerase family protein [Rhizobium sp. 16-449-1b]MBO9195398.1 tautomerase family protein [Rhizobium sp. 16-449-1b]
MPLMKFHLIRGRSQVELERFLQVAHDAMVESFEVPERDRYQLVIEYDPSHLHTLDTGLDIERTEKFVLVEVISRPRTRSAKLEFYERLCELLRRECGIPTADVMITFVQNTDEDWSFGHGRAQFVTGEL